MKESTILHCDLNNFFASVSLLSHKELQDSPVAVCGSTEERHGIVLAKNEIAKKHGVKTAEVIWQAKLKCPNLVILPPDYKLYEKYSVAAREIYERYTDIIEPFGIDECWLDVTGSRLIFGDGEKIAYRIKEDVKRELGCTISVGVSFNKVFAKLGSDMKKPDAVTIINRENFKQKIYSLPIGNLLFAGPKTVEKLNRFAIFTIGDITLCDDVMLKRILGINGVILKQYALGLDTSPVTPYSADYRPKSVGRSVTPSSDITDRETVYKTFIGLSEEISRELRENNLVAFGVCVHTRTFDLKTKESSRSFKSGTDCSITLARRGMDLFDEVCSFNVPLRSVGIRAINLKPKDGIAIQSDLFGKDIIDAKNEIVEDSMIKIRKKFGNQYIKRCIML